MTPCPVRLERPLLLQFAFRLIGLTPTLKAAVWTISGRDEEPCKLRHARHVL